MIPLLTLGLAILTTMAPAEHAAAAPPLRWNESTWGAGSWSAAEGATTPEPTITTAEEATRTATPIQTSPPETTQPTRIATAMPTTMSTVPPTRAPSPAGCFADCNSSGSVTASDIGRINTTMLLCGPCPGGVAGGVATGCAGFRAGCTAADFNLDGCVRASELGRANHNILRFPGGCPVAPP